ncbi:hypothetical protein ACP4OV_029444 [Aristida adscensionis]
MEVLVLLLALHARDAVDDFAPFLYYPWVLCCRILVSRVLLPAVGLGIIACVLHPK